MTSRDELRKSADFMIRFSYRVCAFDRPPDELEEEILDELQAELKQNSQQTSQET